MGMTDVSKPEPRSWLTEDDAKGCGEGQAAGISIDVVKESR